MIRPQSIGMLLLAMAMTPAIASAGLFSITPDADTFIDRADTNRNFGADQMLYAVHTTTTSLDRKLYLRFNLLTISEPTITAAALSIQALTPPAATSSVITFNVFGLKDDDPDEDWPEGTGTTTVNKQDGISWNTAPANVIASGDGVDSTRTVSLGTFTLDGNLPQFATFSNGALVDFLQSDTNNFVTLIITRGITSQNDTTGAFPAKENLDPSFGPAQLDITAVPEPGTIGLFAVGMIALIGRRWRHHVIAKNVG